MFHNPLTALSLENKKRLFEKSVGDIKPVERHVAFGQLKIIIKTVTRLFTCSVRLGALILIPGAYFSHIEIA